ncbi:MAG: hypothetical protein LBG48_04820 [Rickettsiales bacterium]|nr:hypothetical protein [Rickettsiales bacterium]
MNYYRNSSSAIQVTMKTKNAILYFLLSIIILDCGVSSLRFDCATLVSPKRTNTAMTEWGKAGSYSAMTER